MSDSRPLLVDGSSGSIQGSDAQREFTPQESSLGPAATTTLLTESPWRLMLMGQCVSLLLCGTAVFSEYLAGHNFNAPTTQSLLNYSLLLLVYIPVLYRRGRLRKLLSSSWVWFLVLAVVDVEANFVIVKAYEYVTTVTEPIFISFFFSHLPPSASLTSSASSILTFSISATNQLTANTQPPTHTNRQPTPTTTPSPHQPPPPHQPWCKLVDTRPSPRFRSWIALPSCL